MHVKNKIFKKFEIKNFLHYYKIKCRKKDYLLAPSAPAKRCSVRKKNEKNLKKISKKNLNIE
jgi:hypothetical protein